MDSDYTYTTSYSSTGDPGAALAFLGIMAVIGVVAYIVFSFFLSKIFKKAGEEAWKAWVPVYNSWVFLEIGGQKGFWALLAFVPFLNIASVVFMAIAAYQIGLNLQKEGWFVILYILFAPVWLIWLAMDDSKWKGSEVPASAAAAPSYQPPATTSTPQAPVTPQGATDDNNSTPPTTPPPTY